MPDLSRDSLSHDTNKTSALEISKPHDVSQGFGKQPTYDIAAGISL
jgi:hypothetical protein